MNAIIIFIKAVFVHSFENVTHVGHSALEDILFQSLISDIRHMDILVTHIIKIIIII